MTRRVPRHLAIGLLLIGVFWPLNWALDGMRTHWGFFPLWLGYCLTVDGLTLRRTGTSLLHRGRLAYCGLFLVSIPSWWLFEAINERTCNWVYLSDGSIVGLEYAFFASLSFSTVMPAVFGTAELVASSSWIAGLPAGPRLRPTRGLLVGSAIVGALMLLAVLLWPRYAFALVWTSVYLLVEPLNAWTGRRTLLEQTARGQWRGVLSLALGCVVCGFFWEMWNILSYPKWTYQVPFVDWCRLFEMPVLGYGGYIPFAFELYALYHLLGGAGGATRDGGYLRVAGAE